MGINLTAPPRLLHRPRAIQHTIELTSPDGQADALLRFSPDEPMRFRFQPFALVEEPEGIIQLLAIEQSSGAGAPGKICQLLLHPSGFAIDMGREVDTVDGDLDQIPLAWPQNTLLP